LFHVAASNHSKNMKIDGQVAGLILKKLDKLPTRVEKVVLSTIPSLFFIE
jgi:hypothetical protein